MASQALRKAPRVTGKASACICTRADGTVYTLASSTRLSVRMNEAERLRRAKDRQRARDNARIDAQNAIDARKPRVTNFNMETIHDPRGY